MKKFNPPIVEQKIYPPDHVPKYSMSIYYLKQIMTKKEFKELMEKYIQAKMAYYEKKLVPAQK